MITGGWNIPPRFTDKQRATLAVYLPDVAINALLECCATGRVAYRKMRDAQTRSAVRADVKGIRDAARNLHERLQDITHEAKSELLSGLLSGRLTRSHADAFDEAIRAVRDVCEAAETRLPELEGQSRHVAPMFQIKMIAQVCAEHGIKISAAPGSKFTRIAKACFEAIGIPGGPEHATRELLKIVKATENR